MSIEFKHEQISPGEIHCHRVIRSIASVFSEYQHIEILETQAYGIGLFLDGRIQHVQADEYAYSEAMVHPAITLMKRVPILVLCIGGGPGGVVRELLKYSDIQIVQVELDREVVRLSREYLCHITQGAWENSRAQLIISDVMDFLVKDRRKFDLIINDSSEPVEGSHADPLFTRETMYLIKDRLLPGGMYVTWAGSAAPCSNFISARIFRTVQEVFEHTIPYHFYTQSYGTSWLSLVASQEPLMPFYRSQEEIDRILSMRISGELRLYDGQTHGSMFRLPKDIRIALASRQSEIITLASPLSVPGKDITLL
jgi:spermidine synthase